MRRVAEQIHAACTKTGFFYVRNHGLPDRVVQQAVDAAAAFFALPAEIKRRSNAVNHRGYIGMGDAFMQGAAFSDFKESYVLGLELPADDPDVVAGEALRGPNVWPSDLPDFRRHCSAYFEAIAVCGMDLLSVFAVSLGQSPDFFVDKYTKRLQRTNIIRYPPHPAHADPGQFGGAAHTDYGCITLLWQDSAGGLEIETRERVWVPAPPVEGTLVINVGDLLERWSAGRYVSNLHRVVNRSGRERYSIATFFDPNYRAEVVPASFGTQGPEPQEASILAGEYILNRIRNSFAYRSA